ncbi:TLD domain-containing protein 1 isoform X2 [Zootermopsis nevadensis]|nr:TLD domain-containing protein 1 isoform X2 [Zootermopsis nevadensis]
MENGLLALVEDYFFKNNPKSPVPFDTFISLFIKLAKDPCGEKVKFIVSLLKQNSSDGVLTFSILMEYVKNIISSYVIILTVTDHAVLKSWRTLGVEMSDWKVILMTKSLCQDLEEENIEENIEIWFGLCSQFQKIQTALLFHLYHIPQEHVSYGDEVAEYCLFPMCKGVPPQHKQVFSSVLEIPDVLFLNSLLPSAMQQQWRFCFSTGIHGESFAKMLGLLVDKGPTVIIVKDKEKNVFGGYASESWTVGPNFRGDEKSFLFSLYPEMRVCHSTGYNSHYQYLNIQQQTLPNGLGLGGQFEYFGIWLDAEFGKGHCSETCTTYRNYKMLSATKYFEIDLVEVWAVGPEFERKDTEDVRTSVRESDLEAKALLQMAGKTLHSEGMDDNLNEAEDM